ncbi:MULTISPECIES: MATE family efflux transporter [unclassified Helicobacter]|uniref:MATE family efflux transporter n=1 Tax=unclassified Helicobacter TaxID=2593540 RepID=UPI000CF035E9|nr:MULTISPECIES: MATE family efflux transporter [unclassified Helicobacter]
MGKNLSLRKLSIPIFFEIFLHYASLVINTYMVARHSNYLVGSMGVGNQIFDLFITLFSFLSVGCSIVIAQAIGAKNKTLASKALHQSLGVNILIGLFSGWIIFVLAKPLLILLNTSNDLLQNASQYLKMLAICLCLESISIILASILRVYNLAYFVMLASALMNIVMIITNYYVLYHTNLELLGIGISTIFSRLFLIILLALIFYLYLKIKISFKEIFQFQKDVLKKILHIGSFSAGENLLWIVQYTIAFSFVNQLGAIQTSVQTIYFQISLLIMLIGQAISMGNEIIVGKLVGARYFNTAYRHTWFALYISILASFFVALLNYLMKDYSMQKLDLLDSVKTIMLPLFTLSLILEVGRTFNIVMVNALRASGDAKFPFFTGCIFMFGLSLPLGYILCFYFNLGIIGIWIGFCADEWIRGLVNAYRWKSRKWKNKALV